MAKKPKTTETTIPSAADLNTPINLAQVLSSKSVFQRFKLWVVGSTPLIVHAWSEKARREMLAKQVKATRGGKEPRDPHADFVSSLYQMPNGYGFPSMGLKNAILSSAHKDKGIPRSTVMSALWIDSDIVNTSPAFEGAVCNMPLLRIYGSDPQMREDMVRIGAGMAKTASLAYRAQFFPWALKVTGRFNASVLTPEALAFLIQEAGMASGLGEWRNEKKGQFGSFRLATAEEEEAWEAFAAGGPLPKLSEYAMAAE